LRHITLTWIVGWTALTLVACADPPAPASTPKTVPTPQEAKSSPTADTKAAPSRRRPRPSKAEQHTFDAQLAALDRQLVGRKKIAENNGKSSLAFGKVASLYLARARLSGDYDDYGRAEEAIATAFEVSSHEDFGPFMVRARLNYTLHRLDRVDEDFALASKVPTRESRILFQRELFAANLAFLRGQYPEALTKLEAAVERQATLSSLASLALYHWKSADFDEAEALYLRALEAHEGDATEPLAWVHLQLGLMDLDRGRWDDARVHYREGEALISGYWLIEEHIAEILTLKGETEQAKTIYRAIIERTNNPEFMDAMAGIHEAAGETEEAAAWVAKARERYDAQLLRFPEAAYGHALGHFLDHGDPIRAVELAEKNHALRPNADAKRLLADAYLLAGRVDDAKRMIEQALATPMRSADLHASAAAVYAASGATDKAEEQRAKARAINPTID